MPFCSPPEAARQLDVTGATIRAWLHRHPDLGLKIGGRWRLSERVVAAIARGVPLAEAGRVERAPPT